MNVDTIQSSKWLLLLFFLDQPVVVGVWVHAQVLPLFFVMGFI